MSRRRAPTGSKPCCWAPVWARFSPKFCTEVQQVTNMKVVDLTTPYNFHKRYGVFLNRFCIKGTQCLNAILCQWTWVTVSWPWFPPFSTKNGNVILHESCVPRQ
jgi:hypothetical protein